MVVTTVMTMLCLTGVAFYVRFLVALCMECKARWTFSWVRLHSGSKEYAIPEEGEHKKPVRAARNGSGMGCSLGTLDNTDRSEKGYI